jgi:hypothetical protein
MLVVKKLEQLGERRSVAAQQRCISAYRARFGEPPSSFEQRLGSMTVPLLGIVERLITEIPDAETLHRRFEHLTSAYAEGMTAGKRQALRVELQRRFGHLVHDLLYTMALDCADDMDLAICFDRLHQATTIDEVFGALFRRLKVNEDDFLLPHQPSSK